MADIHRAASEGFSAGADAYAAGRPNYPAQIVPWLCAELRLGPGRVALDLGSGTGKLLPSLRETGARLIAVEPVAAMRDRLVRDHPDVQALDGRAEAIPLPDACVDAVVCAQAFHWFATPEALAEIARVLRPGGALGLIWNIRDERVGWVAALSEIMSRHEGDVPHFHSGAWRRLFPAAGFGPLRETRVPHRHVGPPEAVILDRTLSVSFIAALPDAARAAVAAEVRALIAATPALAGRDEVVVPYETAAFACTRLG
ncbi:class I SAM-dependent methyltransferase [Methylobacterium nodulans]|uniref:Methyltransferase type 11 n=1 Tax=Methylobacterium nodulans (strain LMG 21967 / CNCM I-2342 / ORS 2060) TaxID=460265 RepID=B8IX14_METNO|nr:class I SAM-dependent methyltransferase [Methylobacterium nodulans]ACL63055.1 Methyltransferase type 11 [Methylobacterium nodulans ORS 2060]